MPEYLVDEKKRTCGCGRPCGTFQEGVRPCPACGQARTGRKTSAYSDRCRAATSRRNRTEGQAEGDRRGRELLGAALRVRAWVEEPKV